MFLSGIFLVSTEAAGDKTSMDVKFRMSKGENVPVIIILKDQPSFKSLSKENAVSSLKSHASGSQQKLAALLDEEKSRGKAEKIKQFWIVNAIAVNASPELIERLAKRDDVASIELDAELHVLEDFSVQVSQGQIDNATPEITRINATKVWELGIDGTGINVSVIDTGIYASHPDIAGRVIKWVDYISGLSSPYDDHGHGTHVAGTVGGNGSAGTTTGVAPNVSLFVAKVCNSAGTCPSSSIVSGIEWSVEYGANIISISLGGSRDATITTAVNNAINAGVVVIAAAGNSGPGAGTINFPAGEKNVIAVGAVDSSDNIANFSGCGGCSSSRGPITVDGEVLTKPDVSAPGKDITSLYYLSNGYAIMSGTSMATPHVSGAVALLLHAANRQGTALTPVQIKNILENTSIDLYDTGKDNISGAGRINVSAAVSSIDVGPSVIANPTGYIGSNTAAQNGTAITLNATITDAVSGVKNASVNVSSINTSLTNVFLTNVSGFWTNSSVIINASDGTYYLNVTAYDNASNVNNTVQLTVKVDNTPPLVTANPTGYIGSNTAAQNGTAITLNTTITDAVSGVKNASVNVSSINASLTNISLSNSSGFWTNSSVIVNASDGIYYLNITAYDNMSYVNNSIQLSVTVDNTLPLVSINQTSYLRGSAANNGSIIGFNVSANDPLVNGISAGLKNASVNASLINNTGTIELLNYSGFWKGNATFDRFTADGNHSLNVTFFDNAGNKNDTVQINISIDNAPPSVTNVSLSSQFINVTSFTNISANITSLDAVSQVNQSEVFARVTYPNGTSINYGMNIGGGSLFYYNFTDTAQYGRFNVTILANDTTGNTNSTQRTQFATAFITNNGSVEIQANNSTVVNAPLSNTTLYLFANNTSVGAINITQSRINITSEELNITNPGIYVLINASDSIKNNLSYVVISVNYTHAEVSSYVESSLRLYRWNTTSSVWDKLSGAGSYPYVNDAGVDYVNNFVWANVTELSEFAVSGEIYVAPAQSQSSSSGGGGGGGGGGASGENASNIFVKEKYDLHIFKDKTTSYRFTNGSNPVKFVNITGNVSAGEINVAVEVLRGTSTLVNISPPGNVYKNMNIWVGTSGFAVPRNIQKATVEFSVDKNWIKENSIKSIDLLRYDTASKEWVTLPTNKIGENATEEYHQGETDRFSSFAIAGEKSSVSTIVSQAKAMSPTATAKETPVASESPLINKDSSSEKVPDWTYTLILFVIVVALSAVYIFKLKRR